MRLNIKRKFIATLCAMTMIVGNMSIGTYADDAVLEITDQPTNDNPTVTVNKDDVTYQWYKAEAADEHEVAELAGTIVGDEIIAATVKDNYVGNGVWADNTGSTYFHIGMLSGDIVRVTPQEGYEVTAELPGMGTTLTDDGTGVLVYEATRDVVTELYIDSATEDGVSAKVEIVRNGVTYPVVNGMKEVAGDAICAYLYDGSYDADNEDWNSNSQGELVFEIYLKEKQTVNFNMDNIEIGEMNINAYNYDECVTIPSNGVYSHFVLDEGFYRFEIDNGISFDGDITVSDIGRGQAVAGQNTDTLTEFEEGEIYSCLVTCGEEEVWSDYFMAEIAIVIQPTSKAPTVKVNYPDGINSYQWYGTDEVLAELIHSNDVAADGQYNAGAVYSGDCVDGTWYSEGSMLDVALYAEKGKKIVITLPEDFEGRVNNYDTGENFTYVDGVYEGVIVEDDGYINFTIEGEEDFTAEIQVEVYQIADAIEGETTATLENYEGGKTYVCKIVSKKGTELLSDYVSILVEIITQPTATNPSVEVNFPDAVVGYQWYNADIGRLSVVKGQAGNGEITVGYVWSGSFVDGIWESDTAMIDMSVVANKGDKVIITLPEDFAGEVYEYYSGELFRYNNGVYEYVIDSTDGYINFVVSSDTDFTAKIQVESYILQEAIATETAPTLNERELGNVYVCEVTCEYGDKLLSDFVTMEVAIVSQPTATNPAVEVNFPDEVTGYQWYEVELKNYEVVDESMVTSENASEVIGAETQYGVYEDGVWTSEAYDMGGGTIAYDMSVLFEIEEGCLIKIVPSTENIMDVIWQHQNEYVDLKYENGVYYYEVKETGEHNVYVSALEEFTAEITVEKTTVLEAVEEQTTNKLTNHEAGDYICEITLSDDTVLLSDAVSIAEADIKHTYTDEYDADCNDCGAVREIPEKETEGETEPETEGETEPDTKSEQETETKADTSGDGVGNDSDKVEVDVDKDNTNANTDTTSPNTGDGTNMILIIGLVLVGAVGVMAMSVYEKKRVQ